MSLAKQATCTAVEGMLWCTQKEVERGQYLVTYKGGGVGEIRQLEDHKYLVCMAYRNDEEIRTDNLTIAEALRIYQDFRVWV